MVVDICNLVVTPRSLPTKPRDGSEMTVLFCRIQLSRLANPPNLNRICSTIPSQTPAEFRQWMLVFRAHPLTIPDCLEYFCPPDHTYAALWRVNKQTLKKTHPPLPHFLCVTHMAVHGCLKDKTTRTKSPMHPTSMSLACHRCDTTVAIDTTNFAYSASKCAQSLPSSFLPCR